MAPIDLSKYFGGSTGTWTTNIGPFRATLPEYRLTERVFAGNEQGPTTPPPTEIPSIGNNTSVPGQQHFGDLNTNPQRTVTSNPNPNPNPAPSGGGDSRLQQLLKIVQETGGNPSERGELARMLSDQQQSSQQDYASQISESYEPYKQELTNMEGTLQSGFNEQSANLASSAENEAKKYDTQGEELIQGTQTEESKFNQTLQGALAEAIRSYNALKQQATARFGGASSAGQAVGELANQEFLRQQGQTQQAGVEGSAKFGVEYGKIKSYVQQKKDDLDQFKKEALAQLRDNLNKGLNEIRLRKADVEANKTRDRLALLQSTIEQARNMALQDQQFRQQLGLAAVSKLQEVSGRQFTPQEWSSYINGFMNEMKSSSPNQIGTGPVATKGSATPLAYNPTRRTNQDELQALQNQGFA